jgi:hypothetical protein
MPTGRSMLHACLDPEAFLFNSTSISTTWANKEQDFSSSSELLSWDWELGRPALVVAMHLQPCRARAPSPSIHASHPPTVHPVHWLLNNWHQRNFDIYTGVFFYGTQYDLYDRLKKDSYVIEKESICKDLTVEINSIRLVFLSCHTVVSHIWQSSGSGFFGCSCWSPAKHLKSGAALIL